MSRQTWEVLLQGSIWEEAECYELSVVACDNFHGRTSLGWHGENKIPLASSGDASGLVSCDLIPRSPDQVEKVLKIAQVLSDALNALDLDDVKLRPEFLPNRQSTGSRDADS